MGCLDFGSATPVDEAKSGEGASAIIDLTDMLAEFGVTKGAVDCAGDDRPVIVANDVASLVSLTDLEMNEWIGLRRNLFVRIDSLWPLIGVGEAGCNQGGEFGFDDDPYGLHAATGVDGAIRANELVLESAILPIIEGPIGIQVVGEIGIEMIRQVVIGPDASDFSRARIISARQAA